MDQVTVVMYHYVRPIAGSKHSKIKGLEFSDFQGQLDFIQDKYNVITSNELISAKKGNTVLPKNPILLTFDDGYSDHYKYVTPELYKRGLSGLFFPPSSSVEERKLLDVNKIHLILAIAPDLSKVVRKIDDFILNSDNNSFRTLSYYKSKFLLPNRYDTKEINYIKKMLQQGLPFEFRKLLLDEIFFSSVSKDQLSFADELYVTLPQISEMIDQGMEIGSHGHEHSWLDTLSENDQLSDINRSLDMLERLGLSREEFFFCYPYGGYNAVSIKVLEALKCAAAFNVSPQIVDLTNCKMLELPRIDTNDLPKVCD